MEQTQMQELLALVQHSGSPGDAGRLISQMQVSLEDLHEYLFQLHPGARVHMQTDSISAIEPHVHRFYEVIFVLQGSSVQYILDSQRYQLNTGDMLLIPPGLIHHPLLYPADHQSYRRYLLWLEADFFRRICEVFPSVGFLFAHCREKDDYLLHCRESEFLQLQEAFAQLCREVRQQQYGWEAQTTLGALSVMNRLSRAYQDKSLTVVHPAEQTKFDTAIGYINQHLSEPLTLEAVARHIYVSKSTLSHWFRNNLGISVYQYIQQKRLLKAKLLILEGEAMGTVCEKCGFEDYPTFYRAFRKMYGMSPNSYRKSHCQP